MVFRVVREGLRSAHRRRSVGAERAADPAPTLEPTREGQPPRALVVLNPVAGQRPPGEARRLIAARLDASGWRYRIYETTGQDDLAGLIREARREDLDVVVAAGGDGTVAAVADCLVNTGTPLAILPLGTGNVLSLELGIPQGLPEALSLLLGEHRLRDLDAMQSGGRHFLLQIGVGLDSLMIRDTDREAKRRLGRLAYVGTLVGKVFGHKTKRFTLVVDGQRHRLRAWQIEVANAGALGSALFRWGPDIRPDDGRLDVVVVRVRGPIDYLRLAWRLFFPPKRKKSDPSLRYFTMVQQVTVGAARPLPVQADGEIIGTTPFTVRVVPRALKVVVPVSPAAAEPPSATAPR